MSPCLRTLTLLGLSACAPDRLYVEGTHGWGSIDPADKIGDYDTEGDAVTVGLSFPLQSPPERVVVERYVMGSPAPALPTAQPAAPREEGGGIPWEALALVVGGGGLWEGTRRGAPVITRHLKKKTTK